MPRDYAAVPRHQVRRRDRVVDDDAWIRAMLHRVPFGALATAHDGQPFINSVEYAGVTVFGTAAIVDQPAEARHALQRMLDKYAPHLHPGRDYRGITDEEVQRTAVYRVAIEAWSGKSSISHSTAPASTSTATPTSSPGSFMEAASPTHQLNPLRIP